MQPQKPNINQSVSTTGARLRWICCTKRDARLLLIFSLALLLMLYATYRTGLGTKDTNCREGTPMGKQIHASEDKTKPFIYLTQTEQCLPAKLSSSRGIGDSDTCNCDVIVLSYKKECQEKKPSHISYIFVTESTWTSGRNILYFIARARMRRYHYYIFLDDDVDLEFNSFTPQEMKKLTPFRAFERWLLDNEPAIGNCPGSREDVDVIFKTRRMLCGINETSMVVPVMCFDAILNAFHHKAIDHILPYPTKYDKESWWSSQLHVICSVELKFRGQALVCVPITVHNGQHRDYPRMKGNFDAQVHAFVQEIQNRAPIAYRNRTLFDKLKNTSIEEYVLNTTTYCMNTAPRPIVPYSHFERESQLEAKV
ncbi:hypothetical protein ACROYT_G043518 [Oculina patagonica]